jgi:putative phosphoesterase
MKIGIISDSHDHLPNLRHALQELAGRGVQTVIHCGDLVAPFVTLELGRFAGQVHTVFGNNDGDRFLSLQLAREKCPNVTHHGEIGVLELSGQKLAFSHYREHSRGLAAAEGCQLAAFGHTHVFYEERTEAMLVVNPGELLGFKGRPSFCVYDTATSELEQVLFSTRPWPESGAWA